MQLGLQQEFNAALQRLGPFGPNPRLAAAVSGGADSTALALLTQDWLKQAGSSGLAGGSLAGGSLAGGSLAGGGLIALIVDHGLRAESAAEAALTAQRLQARGIEARIIRLSGLTDGAKLQERARLARYEALAKAAREAGALFLLLGHHRADQSETVAMRAARGASGLQGIAGWTARNDVLLLRPLLNMQPDRLRLFLQEQAMKWVEDPANRNPRFERVRLRLAGTKAAPVDTAALRLTEGETAEFIARNVMLRPEGFAVIHADSTPPAALAALLRVIGGARYAPAQANVARLAAGLRPATLGGVRIIAAGKLGPGWLLARESAACAPAIPAADGALWDGRFRLIKGLAGAGFGALGADAAKFRKSCLLPALVLRGLPCLRLGNEILPAEVLFSPPAPAASHPFNA